MVFPIGQTLPTACTKIKIDKKTNEPNFFNFLLYIYKNIYYIK